MITFELTKPDNIKRAITISEHLAHLFTGGRWFDSEREAEQEEHALVQTVLLPQSHLGRSVKRLRRNDEGKIDQGKFNKLSLLWMFIMLTILVYSNIISVFVCFLSYVQ